MKIPEGWDTEEKRAILAKRRVYYEVKLHDWLVKHDLDGDGLLVKTLLNKGVGYDRPAEHDEINIDLKVFQMEVGGTERVYQEYTGLDTLMSRQDHISNTTKKILQSMKTKEKVRVKVYPEYFTVKDPAYVQERGLFVDRPLIFDIEMHGLVRVEDVYKDGTTFQKTVIKGSGTASPYSDFEVICKKVRLTLLCSEGAHRGGRYREV